MRMIDYETLQEQAKWAEYKSSHPNLKSKIIKGLPIRKSNETFYGIRFFFENGKRYAEVLYKEDK